MMTYDKPAPGMVASEKPAPDAGLRRVLVYTLPIDLISLVTTVEWFASLAGLITWHVWYIRKENLDA